MIVNRDGNSYAGTDVCHVKTEGVGTAYHNMTGDVTFWKTGTGITDVTTTVTVNEGILKGTALLDRCFRVNYFGNGVTYRILCVSGFVFSMEAICYSPYHVP